MPFLEVSPSSATTCTGPVMDALALLALYPSSAGVELLQLEVQQPDYSRYEISEPHS